MSKDKKNEEVKVQTPEISQESDKSEKKVEDSERKFHFKFESQNLKQLKSLISTLESRFPEILGNKDLTKKINLSIKW